MIARTCRFCRAPLTQSFCDLGLSPLSNALVRPENASRGEKFYPLHAYVCGQCFLVQLEEFEPPEAIFGADYAYFSSYSDTWLAHAKAYADHAIERFALDEESLVVEVASNDGYLLQHFLARGVPVLGIEPAANVAEVAKAKGIDTRVEFFGARLGAELAASGQGADLIAANNVLAHVPDINDFVAGFRAALAPEGVVTVEFPHLLRLVREVQFDTIYHEHFSYLSLLAVERIFAAHGLAVFDVAELPTHGGSLRIYATHAARELEPSATLRSVRAQEEAAGMGTLDFYRRFTERVERCKRSLLTFLIEAKSQGKRVVAYGAPAKGTTLLNYCGVRTDFVDFAVDRSPHKQGMLMPGVRVPIVAPSRIDEVKPDYVLILPWNLREEIMEQLAGIRAWGGRFVTPLPETKVWP